MRKKLKVQKLLESEKKSLYCSWTSLLSIPWRYWEKVSIKPCRIRDCWYETLPIGTQKCGYAVYQRFLPISLTSHFTPNKRMDTFQNLLKIFRRRFYVIGACQGIKYLTNSRGKTSTIFGRVPILCLEMLIGPSSGQK